MSKGIISFPPSRPFSGHQGALDIALQIPLTLVGLQLCLSTYTKIGYGYDGCAHIISKVSLNDIMHVFFFSGTTH